MIKERYYILGRILLLLLIAIAPAFEALAQQKVQFTQYMFDGLMINPAYAGADGALSLTFIHRDQWSGVDGAPSTQTLSAHTLFKKKQVGVGLSIMNDVIGVHKNLSILTDYAYHLKVADEYILSFGLQAGILKRQSDYASLLSEPGNNQLVYNESISRTSFDFGAGLYFRGPRLDVGFSAPGIIRDKVSLNDTTSLKVDGVNNFLFGKYRITANENLDIEPSVLFKYLYGLPLSFDLNMNFVYRSVITAGVSYRKSESFDFLLKCQITEQLQFGYAYDYPIGNLSALTNASHEIMVHYLFSFKQSNVASPR